MDSNDTDYFSDPVKQFFVKEDNIFINEAMEFARKYSLDKVMPTGSVIVKNGEIIGRGANGSNYHDNNICERVKLKIPTGQGYELCEGCHPKNHSEVRAVEDAVKNNKDTSGTDLYLWGHWWLCRWCRDTISKAGIKNIYMLENSEVLFNKNKKDNIVGKQFEKYANKN